jgi:hypothetical protein
LQKLKLTKGATKLKHRQSLLFLLHAAQHAWVTPPAIAASKYPIQSIGIRS